jgi:hypothetical protein
MKFADHRCSSSSNFRDAFSVQSPEPLSLLWMLECLSALSVPLAIIGVVAAANYMDLVTLN